MKGKNTQISKIAKELELSTQKIVDFLLKEYPEVDVSKGFLSKVDDEAYGYILKKFNPEGYKEFTEKKSEDDGSGDKLKSAQKKQIDIKSRIPEIEEILSANPKEAGEEREVKRSRRKIKGEEEPSALEVKLSEVMPEPAVIKQEDADVSKEKDDKSSKKPEPQLEQSKPVQADNKRTPVTQRNDKPYVRREFQKSDKETVHDQQRPDRGFKKDYPKSSAAPVTPVVENADSADKKSKLKKKTDDKDSIKEDKAAKSKAVFKRRRHKNVSVVVADGDVVVSDDAAKSGKKRRKKDKVNHEEVKDSVKDTLSKMSADTAKSFKKRKKRKAQADGTEVEIEVNVIGVSEFISTSELANKIGVSVTDIISKCFSMGLMVTINQRLDKEKIELIAAEFDTDVEFESEYDDNFFYEDEHEDPSLLREKNPIITIMGHVDHGKTSLLDYIRNTKVVAGESGGITQHIGAYVVDYKDKNLTFLDTPGHEAFTAMRSRGAKITDIVIIVIAADDRVNAQTNEAIDHALLAEVPLIFAINKMDKSSADAEKIRTQLSQRNILVEQWGGKYQSVEISAKTGLGIEALLDAIVMEADMLELKANPFCQAIGTVIESKLDKGFGAVSTILVQKGTLKVGDTFVCGQTYGKVRAMLNERRENVFEAKPAYPVLVLGFSGSPNAGDSFIVVDNEQKAKMIAGRREQINRAQSRHKVSIITLDNVSEQIKLGDVQTLNLIIKGDADGSVEAISDTLMKVASSEVGVKILSKGVGAITEGDVLLAEASGAIILGFHVRPNLKAKDLAQQKKVEIRIYSIIYDLFQDVKNALEGMLKPLITEELLGTAEVRQIFKVPKLGTIAGSYVLSGKVIRNAMLKVIREGIEVYQGKLTSLKRLKDDAKEVAAGFECGIGIDNFNDFKENDIIEVFEYKETQRKLD
ncbi:TPA: translation initiation factor IF-2 [Candidatus Delongbacteria bacterium]|nr:MAG: translation initiation factor IF-2 [Candidatus Delongbacteria bacterium GWF2_40_14]HAQ61621.1 translation initiation factor IF-2 [Candidatus Delongbacteria bacterium]